MNYHTATLPCGLRVIFRESASPVVYCGYEISAGSRNEAPGEEGLAHFCEHTTFKGTHRRRAWQIVNCLEAVGGDLNAFTTKEDTVYYAAVLRDHVGRAVDLLTDIVFHSIYPQRELDMEKEVICDEIESYNDSPAELIYDEFENQIFGGHPLGHNILGTTQRVRGYGTDDALRFTRKHYRPANTIFFAYGDISFATLLRQLERATAAFPAVLPVVKEALKAPEPYKATEMRLRRGTHQAHVMLGCRSYSARDERRMPLYLLNNILGGPGMNARLNLILRERRGLVYTVESTMVSYGDTGIWSTYFGCDGHDVNRCLKLVRNELQRFADSPLTETRLRAAKKQIKGQLGVACDNRESFALDFGKSFLHYGWEKDISQLYARIESVTALQIQQVAGELFREDNLSLLVYEPD